MKITVMEENGRCIIMQGKPEEISAYENLTKESTKNSILEQSLKMTQMLSKDKKQLTKEVTKH